MAEETTNEKKTKAGSNGGSKPAAKKAKAKKDKPPPIEKKPFEQFINQHYLPALQETLSAQGCEDLDLSFTKAALPGMGTESWQVVGRWMGGNRQFVVGFPKADINKTMVFAYATDKNPPSTLEPFLGDERKISLDLLVFYVVQRLNAQKWLDRN